MPTKGTTIKFWSKAEIKIAKNFKPSSIIKNNLLPNRDANSIRNLRTRLKAGGENIYSKIYDPITSTLKVDTNDKKSFKFYKSKEDSIILNNSAEKAAELLPNRSITSIYSRKYYLGKKGVTTDSTKNTTIKHPPIKYDKNLNLTINDIELKVTNVKSIWVDKNNIDIKTH